MEEVTLKILTYYRAVKEMAEGISDIKRRLRDSSDQIRQNLMMIFLWRDASTVHHWVSEIYGACHKVSLCRGNNKFPKKSIILQELWLYWQDCYYKHLKHYIRELENKECKLAPIFNSDNMYKYLEEYYKWFSNSLSTEGWVDFEEIESKVQQLVHKYSLN